MPFAHQYLDYPNMSVHPIYPETFSIDSLQKMTRYVFWRCFPEKDIDLCLIRIDPRSETMKPATGVQEPRAPPAPQLCPRIASLKLDT